MIMIVRHAEKPSDDGTIVGVALNGRADSRELSVRGWQRAGALVRFFAIPSDPGIVKPSSLFATKTLTESESLRPQHTLTPLSDLIGVQIDISHAEGDEVQLAGAVMAARMPVLIAWHHEAIPALVTALTGDADLAPPKWPSDRFDLVWLLTLSAGGSNWNFRQVPQSLLAEDE